MVRGFCESLSSVNASSGNSLSHKIPTLNRIASNKAINISLLKDYNCTAHIFSLLRVSEVVSIAYTISGAQEKGG